MSANDCINRKAAPGKVDPGKTTRLAELRDEMDSADVMVEFLMRALRVASESTITDFDGFRRATADHDVVFGIWLDPIYQFGIGWRLIKGQARLAVIEYTQIPEVLTYTAIPCGGAVEAETMRQLYGDGAKEH